MTMAPFFNHSRAVSGFTAFTCLKIRKAAITVPIMIQVSRLMPDGLRRARGFSTGSMGSFKVLFLSALTQGDPKPPAQSGRALFPQFHLQKLSRLRDADLTWMPVGLPHLQ